MRLQLDSSVSRPADVQPGSAGSASSRAFSNVESQDSISISTTSAGLSRLAADRAGRIQQLTVSVRSDAYNVSGAAIGNAILTSAGG